MNKSIFREIKESEDVTDIIARIFVFLAIPAALFVIVVALWTAFRTQGNACGFGIC